MATQEIDLVKDSTMKDIAAILAANGAGQGEHGLQFKSYDDIQRVVRLGLAPRIFSIGDIIEVGRETKIQASLGEHNGITAVSVNEDVFVAAMDEAGEKEYEFAFDGSAWRCGDKLIILSDYGLTVTGTAAKGDTFVIVETADAIEMVVMGFIENDDNISIKIKDKSKKYGMILQSKELLYNIQFDAAEALYYCEEGLEPGTYNFTIVSSWSKALAGTYQFNLTKAIPAGGQIVGPYKVADVEPANWTFQTYASASSTTVIENFTVTEGSEGTSLGNLTPAINGNMNSIHRVGYGSNKWSESAIRQHLNSNKIAGQVWTPKSKWDRPPSWAMNTAGFMHGLDPEFIKVCADVELLTVLNTVCDTTTTEGNAGTGYETTIDKFFIPSRPEIFGGGDNNSDKGTPWPYYKLNSDAPNGSSNAGADSNRVKVYASNKAVGYWWLRSPHTGYAYIPRYVNTAGQVGNDGAYNAYGLAPACVVA